MMEWDGLFVAKTVQVIGNRCKERRDVADQCGLLLEKLAGYNKMLRKVVKNCRGQCARQQGAGCL